MDMKKFSLAQHDPQIVALIAEADRQALALWAMDCFNRGRYLFDKAYPENEIIDTALATLTLWINDGIPMWEARKYCWVVLKAARDIEPRDKVACQILRACSQTLATCHVPTHAEGAAMYVISAMQHFYREDADLIARMEEKRAWQIQHLLGMKKS